MNDDTTRKWKHSVAALLARLDKALLWVGLEHGRAATYKKLMIEYYDGQRSNSHWFAFFQAMEILGVYDGWVKEAEFFPGLKDRISFVLKKGTILPEDEGLNSNRPRNDGFVYMLAAKLFYGPKVPILSVDGFKNTRLIASHPGESFTSDIVLLYNEDTIRVECKRPMSKATLNDNVDSAFTQIANANSSGIIAVDVSKLIEQPGQVLNASTLDDGSEYVTNQIEKIMTPLAFQFPQSSLVGMFGYACIPLVSTIRSEILASHGKPFELENFRTIAACWVAIRNKNSPKGKLIYELQRDFERSSHDVPPSAVSIR